MMLNRLKKLFSPPEKHAVKTETLNSCIFPPGELLAKSESHKALGSPFFAKGQLKEASNSYLEATALNPQFCEAYFSLGLVSKELRLFDDAKRYLQKAVAIDPQMAD